LKHERLFLQACAAGALLLYVPMLVIFFYSEPTFHWEPRITVETLVPMISWLLLTFSLEAGLAKKNLFSNLVLWTSLATFSIAGLGAVFSTLALMSQNIPVYSGTAIHSASDMVDASIRALSTGILLGCLMGIAAPPIGRLLASFYKSCLHIQAKIGRSSPATVSLSNQGSMLNTGFRRLLGYSVVFGIGTLAVIYSKFLPVFIIQPQGVPTIVSGFVDLFCYAAVVPAAVYYLDISGYAIRRTTEEMQPLSGPIMKFFGAGFSIATIIAILSVFLNSHPFTRNPLYVLLAIVNTAPAAYAILGSCLSVYVLVRGLNIGRWGLLALVPILVYRTDLYDMLFLGRSAWPFVDWAIAFGYFTHGIFISGYFVSFLPTLLAAVVLVVLSIWKGFVQRSSAVPLILFSAIGVGMGMILPLMHWESPDQVWVLWMPMMSILNWAALGATLRPAIARNLLRRMVTDYAPITLAVFLFLIWTAMAAWNPPPGLTMSEARTILISIAQVLTTVLAISVSLLLVGLQYVSQMYTPRMLHTLLRDRLFIGYIVSYAASISVVVASLNLGFPSPVQFAPLGGALSLYCVLYLVILVFHAPTFFDPSHALSRLANRLSPNFCERSVQSGGRLGATDREVLVGIEQILIASIVRNDVESFRKGLVFLQSPLDNFLEATGRKLTSSQGHTHEIRETPSSVFPNFVRIYRQLAWEGIIRRREEHLVYLCASLEELMIQLHKIRSFRAFEWLSDLYENTASEALDKRLLTFLDYHLRGLRELVRTEMQILDEPNDLFNISKRTGHRSEEERMCAADIRIMRDHLFLGRRVDCISKCAQKGAKYGLRFVLSFYMSILSEILDKILSLPRVEERRAYVSMFLYKLVETHKGCVENGVTAMHAEDLHDTIEKMEDPAERHEFGYRVMRGYAEMEMYSIRKGLYDGIWEWGVNGRYLVKDYPEQTAVVIDVLEEALKTLKSRLSPDNRFYYSWARKDLTALRDWEGHGHKEITRRVERILKKYPELK